MCGIVGYFAFGKGRPYKSILNNLLLESESRGSDATGVAFIASNDKLKVIKDNKRASTFILNSEWRALEEIPKYMIMHTRAATKGSAYNNCNNHPVYRKGLAIVHNGVVYNDDELYAKFGFKRDGQVDTEIILALLEKRKELKWSERVDDINNLSGSFAIASIDENKPNELCLFRHSSPISIAIDEKNEIMYFASTSKILKDSIVYSYKGFRGIPTDLVYLEMENDTGIVINDDGVVDKFKIDTLSKLGSADDWKHKSKSNKENKSKGKSKTHNESTTDFKNNNSWCSQCGKFKDCTKQTIFGNLYCEDWEPEYDDTGSSLIIYNKGTKEEEDICKKCRFEDLCNDKNITSKISATLQNNMCAVVNPVALKISCDDCIFEEGCHNKEITPAAACHHIKFKELATESNRLCTKCDLFSDCLEKFMIDDNKCSSFISMELEEGHCVHNGNCMRCAPQLSCFAEFTIN